jgi:large subunit ribosomal protein L23
MGRVLKQVKDPRQLADLIHKPIVTEKATLLMEKNQYTFEVVPKATKPEIKAAIEYLFDVKVAAVNTINPPRKKKRVGRFIGYKPNYKKAIVTLAEGNSLQKEFFPEL